MPSAQFRIDNQRGLEGQNFVKRLLESWGQKVEEAPDAYFPDWDLSVNGKTLEIKTDLKAHLTGNICIEPEALEHSKADILAYVTDNCKTVYLKELPAVRDFARQWQPKIRGGEFSQDLCLVPRSIFIDRLKPQILTTPP